MSEPEAWLAGPEAWLTGPEAWLAGPQAWLAGPQAWLDGPEGGTDGRTDVRTDGRTDGRTDVRTENLPILQDFVPYRGRCPKREREREREREIFLRETIYDWEGNKSCDSSDKLMPNMPHILLKKGNLSCFFLYRRVCPVRWYGLTEAAS